jgi:MFS family permease
MAALAHGGNPRLGFIQGPARVLVLTAPLFTAYSMVAPFAVLYMDATGLSAAEIGLLASLSFGLRFPFLLVGGHLADRWGRLPTITLFDTVGFPVAFIVLAFADDFGGFLLGMALNATSQGSQAAWHCVLVEEVPPIDRARVAALERAINAGPSVLLPLAGGLWVAGWGLVPAMRAMYLAAAASIALMVLLRVHFMPPSSSGKGVEGPVEPQAPHASFIEAGHFLLETPRARALAVATVCVAFSGGLGVFYSIYVARDLGLPLAHVGLLASLSTGIGVLSLLPLSRGIIPGREPHFVGTSLGLAVVATALFLSARDLTALALSSLLAGLAVVLWTVASTAMWANLTPDRVRAKVVSTVQGLVTLSVVPAAWAGARLWTSVGHHAPWVAVIGLQGFALVVLLPATLGGRLRKSRFP